MKFWVVTDKYCDVMEVIHLMQRTRGVCQCELPQSVLSLTKIAKVSYLFLLLSELRISHKPCHKMDLKTTKIGLNES